MHIPLSKKFLPPHLVLVFLLLQFFAFWFFPVFWLFQRPQSYLGIIFIIIGLGIILWKRLVFLKRKTSIMPFEKPTYLHTTGMYALTRNPVYLSMVMILFGTAILFGAITCFVFPFLFIPLMNVLFISHEEKNLEKKFGAKYLAYKKKVPRWI